MIWIFMIIILFLCLKIVTKLNNLLVSITVNVRFIMNTYNSRLLIKTSVVNSTSLKYYYNRLNKKLRFSNIPFRHFIIISYKQCL